MAQQLKADQTETVRLTKKGYTDQIAAVNAAKEKAKEHNGAAAKATRDFCDDNALDKQAFTQVAKLAKKEAATRVTYIREFLMGCNHMNFFKDGDFFDDDPIEMMRKIVAEADGRKENRDARYEGAEPADNGDGGKKAPHLAPVG